MEEEDQTEELLRKILECLTKQNEKLQIIIDKFNNCELSADDRVSGSEGHYSSDVNNSVDVDETIINNFDNTHNTFQMVSNPELNAYIMNEDCLHMNNMEHIDTTYLVSTSTTDLKLFEQSDQSHSSNSIYTIDRINYQHYNIGTLLVNVDTTPDIDSVLFTAYSSQFKVWDPGLRAVK